jgi:aminopeptidase N
MLSGSSVSAGQPPHRPTASSTAAATDRYAAAVSHPVKDPYYPAEGTTSVDALHYGLDLSWNASTRTLRGVARILFRVTRAESAISLDLEPALHVSSVSLAGRSVSYTHPGHKLRVTTGALGKNSRHTVVIHYAGKARPTAAPTTRNDIPDLGWTVQPDGETWTMQEPFGAFTWYPVNDQPSDKASYDITAHVKRSWRAVSNGRLISNTIAGNERSMHWHLKSPAASYLVTIAIGPYRLYRDVGPHGLPITYWLRPVDNSQLKNLRRTPSMIRWLESKLGRFPFDRIGAVLVPSDSGMETQTMVTIGAQSLADPTFGISNLLHEYAHQWYGDEVTPKNWTDVWLNESFAMYIQIEWMVTHGYASRSAWISYLNQEDQHLRTRYGPPGRYDRRDFASINVYYCGARMLYRLRSMLGTKMLGKVLRGWPPAHRYGNASRAQWIRYLDETTGRNLKHFVHRWLDSTTSPA